MINNQNKIYLKILLFILVFFNLVYSANALGVSTPYWETNPLELYPGQSENVELTLHNIDPHNIKVTSELIEGAEIAKLTSKEYTVPAESNTKVIVTVKIPDTVEDGTEYTVKLKFRQVKVETEGMVQLASGIDTSFPVIVKAPPAPTPAIEEEKPALTNSFLVVILLLILLVGYILLKKKKEE